MTRIKKIKKLPKSVLPKLAGRAAEQFASSGPLADVILEKSESKWIIYADNGEPLFVVGVLRATLLGRPELWFLLCSEFLRHFRRYLREARVIFPQLLALYPILRAKVTVNDKISCRFIEFFSFQPLSTECFNGRYVTIYEARK